MTKKNFINSLNEFNSQQICSAGQRYTPGIDANAPNLKIENILAAVDAMALKSSAYERFKEFQSNFLDDWQRAKSCIQDSTHIQAAITEMERFIDLIFQQENISNSKLVASYKAELTVILEGLEIERRGWAEKEAKFRNNEDISKGSLTRELKDCESKISVIFECIRRVRSELDFIESVAGKVMSSPKLLMLGEWGTGKTHFLCDVVKNREVASDCTLFILAKNFSGKAVLDIISNKIDPASNLSMLLDQMNDYASKKNERALIIIDGINEGSRSEWKTAIHELLFKIKEKKHIGLLVSCRTPFETFSFKGEDKSEFLLIYHHGFEGQEFDAQVEFFQHYKLPLPQVPLLDSEFSRPLTLKLICQSLSELSQKKIKEGFTGIASGQKGMTFVLESFVNRIGKAIEDDFSLPRKSCWLFLKGDNSINDTMLSGVAPNMAITLKDYVTPSNVYKVILARFPSLNKIQRKKFLENLVTSGLLDEDVIWVRAINGSKPRIVYRLPYQRFSDHLIARHLLEKYLDTSSKASIELSFSRGSPLWRIFRKRKYSSEYLYPGWAQALIAEFPERIKKKIDVENRELFFYLPKSSRDIEMYFEPFINGLFWRSPVSFSNATFKIINKCFSARRYDAWNQVIDSLLAISTKPFHPCSSEKIYEYLSGYSLVNRDLTWGEYLRNQYCSPSFKRLIAWAKNIDPSTISKDLARSLIILLSLGLTTVVRNERDILTKALLMLGEKYPDLIFEHTLRTLMFNDPYVSERMLAASYGVTTSSANNKNEQNIELYLKNFSKELFDGMFGCYPKYATHHVLVRDYALGIIQIGINKNLLTLSEDDLKAISPPYPNIPSKLDYFRETTKDELTALGHVIHMDFGNYTIGRLVPNYANYDDKNPVYKTVRAQIEQRIIELGYQEKLFEDIDRDISRYSFNRAQNLVDRYGKKYSWIAYFENYGYRDSRGILPDWKKNERTSDADIDPTFPKPPPTWGPSKLNLLGDLCISNEDWIVNSQPPEFSEILKVDEINGLEGPWVLLDGFVQDESDQADRSLFAFLRGLFVNKDEVGVLRECFLKKDYPGNCAIPDGPQDHYLYAGEVTTSDRYGADLRLPNGQYEPQVYEALSGYDSLNSKRVPGTQVEVPYRVYSWESYHSTLNDFSNFSCLQPIMINFLNLHASDRCIDLKDQNDRFATLYRQHGNGYKGSQRRLFYIREDLLKKYLDANNKRMIWCNWGERNWSKQESLDSITTDISKMKLLEGYKHIHKSFVELT